MIVFLVRVFGVRHRRHLAILLAAAGACVLAGAALFAATQHYPLTTGLYWAITTATTVGYGDVLPHNAAGRVISSAVMLTTIPLLASVFALVTGAAAAAGVRRILAMGHRFPEGAYRIVIGMNSTVPAILDELVLAGDPVVLVADVDPASVRAEVHVVRGDPTQLAVIRSARAEGAQQALITAESDGDVLVIAVLLRKQAPDLPVVGPGSLGVRARGAARTRRPAGDLRRGADRAHAGEDPGGAACGRHALPAGGVGTALPGRG